MKAILMFLLLTELSAAGEIEILSDLHSSGLRTTSAIGKVDARQSMAEALRFLSPESVKVGTFVIYPSKLDMHRADRQWVTHCNYDNWLASLKVRRFMEASFRCPESTQAIKIGDAIVIRTIDTQCAGKRMVVRGDKDPADISIQGTKLHIVDLFIYEGPSRHGGVAPRVTFFVQTDSEVTEQIATEFILYFEKLIPDIDKSIVLRNDRWFITTCRFPLLLSLLKPRSEIPTEEVFLKSKQVACSLFLPWPVRCHRGL